MKKTFSDSIKDNFNSVELDPAQLANLSAPPKRKFPFKEIAIAAMIVLVAGYSVYFSKKDINPLAQIAKESWTSHQKEEALVWNQVEAIDKLKPFQSLVASNLRGALVGGRPCNVLEKKAALLRTQDGVSHFFSEVPESLRGQSGLWEMETSKGLVRVKLTPESVYVRVQP